MTPCPVPWPRYPPFPIRVNPLNEQAFRRPHNEVAVRLVGREQLHLHLEEVAVIPAETVLVVNQAHPDQLTEITAFTQSVTALYFHQPFPQHVHWTSPSGLAPNIGYAVLRHSPDAWHTTSVCWTVWRASYWSWATNSCVFPHSVAADENLWAFGVQIERSTDMAGFSMRVWQAA